MTTIAMTARPVVFEVVIKTAKAVSLFHAIRTAFEAPLTGSGLPRFRLIDFSEGDGFRIDRDLLILSVELCEPEFGSGLQIRVSATSESEAIRRLEKRLAKLGITVE